MTPTRELDRLAALLRAHRPEDATATLTALDRLYWDERARLDALRDVLRLHGIQTDEGPGDAPPAPEPRPTRGG